MAKAHRHKGRKNIAGAALSPRQSLRRSLGAHARSAFSLQPSAFTLLRQNALWLATGMNGVRGSAGFRPGFAKGSAEASKDSTCVAKATTAEQVAPRLAAGCFTLVELLLVMGVIVILVAMLFTVVIGAKDKARKKQALTEAHNIVLALKHYRMEFEQFPNQSQGANDTAYFTNNHLVIQPLIGQNARGKVFLALQLQSTNIADGSTNVAGQTDDLGNFIDPWGVPYVIGLNENGDMNCLISISNVPYYNARAIPPIMNYYYAGEGSNIIYSVGNVDVAVASFGGRTNVSPSYAPSNFPVETWSEPQ